MRNPLHEKIMSEFLRQRRKKRILRDVQQADIPLLMDLSVEKQDIPLLENGSYLLFLISVKMIDHLKKTIPIGLHFGSPHPIDLEHI